MRLEAEQRGLTLQMGSMLRYNPAFQLLFQAHREGWLGEILEIDASDGKTRGLQRSKLHRQAARWWHVRTRLPHHRRRRRALANRPKSTPFPRPHGPMASKTTSSPFWFIPKPPSPSGVITPIRSAAHAPVQVAEPGAREIKPWSRESSRSRSQNPTVPGKKAPKPINPRPQGPIRRRDSSTSLKSFAGKSRSHGTQPMISQYTKRS